MRRMIAQFTDASIRQFRCTDCDWVFHVQQPVTPEVSIEVQRSYAQQWYAAHNCAPASCRPTPFVRRVSPPSADGNGARA
jgi:hypothetical protein